MYGNKTPYEKKHSRKGKEQEEWVLERNALDSSAEQVKELGTILEQLEAKSEEGRRCALRNLIRTLRNRTWGKATPEDNEKLLLQFLIPFMRGPSSVAVLAFEALEVLSTIYGENSDDFFDSVLKPVRNIALTTAPQTLEEEQQAVVGAAVRTLGTLCFFCCDDSDITVDIIRELDKIIGVKPRDASQPVLAAALYAWELIHTTTEFSDEYHERMTEEIWAHLKSKKSSVDTRVAAARCLGFSFSRIASPGDSIDRHRGWISDPDRLTDIINEGAFGTMHSKQDRAKEQPVFKDIASWMLEGEDLPDVTITLNSTKVTFSSWNILARLAAVRRILGSGLQPHLIDNSLLQDVLQFDVPSKPKRRRMKEAEKKYARHVANMAEKAKSARIQRDSTGDDDD